MGKNKGLSGILIFGIIILCTIEFGRINEVKVNAESNGWINVNNSWRYYSGPFVKTGWSEDKGNWYYLDENGNLYYLNDSGVMVKNCYIDEYVICDR